MTTSIIDDILTYAVTALGLSGGPAGLTVNRYRTLPIENSQLPMIVVYPVRDDQIGRVGTEEAPVSDRKLTFWVECRASVVTGNAVDVALDPLIVWTVQQLYLDPRFGGLLLGLQTERMMWDAFQANKVYGAVALEFTAHYMVLAGDATTYPQLTS
jgi:hypothetical protein